MPVRSPERTRQRPERVDFFQAMFEMVQSAIVEVKYESTDYKNDLIK